MQTPFEILRVSEDATDTEVKQAYLQQVKQSPPDRAQEQFQRIHAAYETLKNRKGRVEYALFHAGDADFDSLLEQAFTAAQPSPISADSFIKLLQASLAGKHS